MASARDRADPVQIVPLTPERWDDLAGLFGEAGDPKTCWCMWWRVRSKDWSFAKANETRDSLHRLVDDDRDPAPGLIALRGGRAVGWVGLGPRTDFHRLEHSRVRPQLDDLPVWSIVCFVVSKTERRRGLTKLLLDAAIAYATSHGAPGLEAYPVDPGDSRIPAALGYTGLLSTFEAAGFKVVRQISSPQSSVRRVIVRWGM
ncbi:MAG: GNAT family N-acetyltransferase [Candidatus Dormibacteraeota bacterium]|nr:GNAT family N-acetyltransferase [Candidatus Dormibacteraeota bacterium]